MKTRCFKMLPASPQGHRVHRVPRRLNFNYFSTAQPIVQGFADERDKEHINNGKPYHASDQYAPNGRFFTSRIHHFGIAEPFAGRAGENSLKESIINKEDPRKEPAEIIGFISPIHHIPVPALETEIGQQENKESIRQEVQDPGAVANFSHAAKIVSGE
jgi:hypothetical protein